MDIKLSIIIPAYNAECSLKKIVDKINIDAKNNLEIFEIIIINDGSTDKTLKICKKLSQKYKNVVCIDKQNEGVSMARNDGMSLARGKYIAFCDADDMVVDNYIFKIMNAINNHKDGDMFCFPYKISDGGNNAKVSINEKKEVELINSNEFIKYILTDDKIGGFVWNKVFKRDALEGVVFDSNLEICEDLAFLYHFCNSKKERIIHYISEPIYIYIENSNSASRNLKNLFDLKNGYKYKTTFEQLIKEDPDSIFVKMLRSKLFTLAVSTYIDNVCSSMLDSSQVRVLKEIMRKTYGTFILNDSISIKQKIKFTLFFICPILKKITSKI